jgi:hypothetical protein
MITSKKPMNDGRYLIPFDIKMTRIVSRLMSQIRAPKIRRGTITKVKTSGETIGAAIGVTIPVLAGYPVRVLDLVLFSCSVSMVFPNGNMFSPNRPFPGL